MVEHGPTWRIKGRAMARPGPMGATPLYRAVQSISPYATSCTTFYVLRWRWCIKLCCRLAHLVIVTRTVQRLSKFIHDVVDMSFEQLQCALLDV